MPLSRGFMSRSRCTLQKGAPRVSGGRTGQHREKSEWSVPYLVQNKSLCDFWILCSPFGLRGNCTTTLLGSVVMDVSVGSGKNV